MTTLVLNDILLPAARAAQVSGARAPRMLALPPAMPQALSLHHAEQEALAQMGRLVERKVAVPPSLLAAVSAALARAMAPVDEYVERTIRNLMRQAGTASDTSSRSVH